MSAKKILLVLPDPSIGQWLERDVLRPAGFEVTYTGGQRTAEKLLQEQLPDLVILSETLEDGSALELAASLQEHHPNLPLILLPHKHSEALAIEALRHGFSDYLQPPLGTDEVLQAVNQSLKRRQNLDAWAQLQAGQNTHSLQQQVDSLEALQRVGRKVTSLLDLDNVLTAVVEAAVELTGAEEGSLLLLDERSGELYMRASQNFQEDFVRTFRLPIQDTLAGQVLRTGKPVSLNQETPEKIKTSYLVYALVYVPMIIQDQVIGILGVDNRRRGHKFSESDTILLSALADYAAIAVENARLYTETEVERSKLENILTKIGEGVIVVDHDRRLGLVNRVARSIFALENQNVTGKRVQEVFQHAELVEVLNSDEQSLPSRVELSLEDGRVFNAQLTHIPEIGVVMTMQDISHLKELDHIKSDFVSTVSHDLRSPLTAILGYTELLDRVGPVNEPQREFVRRIQMSVNSITSLINDLLDLGRIEAGFDARKEVIPLTAIIQYAIEDQKSRAMGRSQELVVDLSENLPEVLGNALQLKQMLNNLIGNALKYTQRGGKITVRSMAEEGQVIIQVADNGPGIPLADQPYIFDKFYRGSNILDETPGTGLGLAIVKSIVENHQGRIWVESTPKEGSTFTIVLPVADREL